MLCPYCPASTLVISARSSIEMDYCPQCRGVWLDRGELDKLIERSLADLQPAASAYPAHKDDRYDSGRRQDPRSDGRRPRKSWMSEIFD